METLSKIANNWKQPKYYLIVSGSTLVPPYHKALSRMKRNELSCKKKDMEEPYMCIGMQNKSVWKIYILINIWHYGGDKTISIIKKKLEITMDKR